jgi:hypothetical protein
MSAQKYSIEALVRQAFGLLLEIRRRREARRLLTQAIAFLDMLVRRPDTALESVVVSVQAVRLRDS